MKLRLSASLIALTFVSSNAFAANTLWDEAKQSANQFTGKVVSIGDLDDGIIVRLANKDQTGTFHVCPTYPAGDALSLKETTRVRALFEAFEHGDIVTASFNNPLDRCLANVEISKDPAKEAKKAPTANLTNQAARKGS